jgi:hypothetical protein
MTAAKCPTCGKPATAEHRPFCSTRCADIDLQRWLSGRYVVPGSDDGGALMPHRDDEED